APRPRLMWGGRSHASESVSTGGRSHASVSASNDGELVGNSLAGHHFRSMERRVGPQPRLMWGGRSHASESVSKGGRSHASVSVSNDGELIGNSLAGHHFAPMQPTDGPHPRLMWGGRSHASESVSTGGRSHASVSVSNDGELVGNSLAGHHF